jgi:hypothetical protein
MLTSDEVNEITNYGSDLDKHPGSYFVPLRTNELTLRLPSQVRAVCSLFRLVRKPTTYLLYRQLGWPGTLPVPARRKTPPPDGFTGWDGHYPSGTDAHAFTEEPRWSGANLALRRWVETGSEKSAT